MEGIDRLKMRDQIDIPRICEECDEAV